MPRPRGAAWLVLPAALSVMALPTGQCNDSPAKTLDLNRDGKVVGLALSGGGLRATGVAYGALLELESAGLLDRIDLISAVSGGSIVAASYALGQPLKEFGPKLRANLMTSSLRHFLSPRNIGDGRNVTRTTGFAEALEERFYGGECLTDFRPRPLLLINATNLDTATLFIFSREKAGDDGLAGAPDIPRYHLSADDHAVVKVATAVSASCAVPAVFSPVTLTAYGCSADGRASEPKTIRLGDGGICDNQGIEALLIHRCDVIISVDASADVITEEGYRNYFPGGTKVIPILRQKYKDLLEVHARGMLGSNYIRLKATDEAKEMGAFRVRLTEKDVDTLVTAGRTMVSEQMPAIRAVLGMPHPSTGTSSPP